MKKNLHPAVGVVQYRCASCAARWLTTSTKLDGKTETYEEKEYPSIILEMCSSCHPFFTDKHSFIDTAGRVEKFQKRFAKFAPPAEKTEDKPEAQ